MATILYLHGFASSPSGRKIALLREALEPLGDRVVAPDLNRPSFRMLSFDAIVEEALRVSTVEKPAVVVGSSLGALAALAAAKRGMRTPLVLIAPALAFGSRWIDKLAPGDPVRFFHHGQGKELEIHRRFFEEMAVLEVDREPPPQRVKVLMGVQDESVPFEGVQSTWKRWADSGRLAPGSEFAAIPEGDHGMVAFVPEIVRAIRALAEER